MRHWIDHYAVWLPYLCVAVIATGVHLLRRSRRERHASALRTVSVELGLSEPPSLHPLIDPHRCIGSGGCVQACPEKALGIVNGKAVLVQAASCIGHGACQAACPVEAIQLVFGTDKRGIDIPEVSPDFESNVPGLFIAGELGGMGLIRKAAEQGRQAVEALRFRRAAADALDLIVVGAGPAGLSAGLAAMQHGLRFRLIEQEPSLGGTVYHYPRNKIAMTAPLELALVGRVSLGEIRKERLLEFWQSVVIKTGLVVHCNERMEALERVADGFVVTTARATYKARSVLLAIGRRGTPRKLDVPGEDSAKVVYRLVDASQYRGQDVLVVGGGDSALEAAVALADQPGTRVMLSHRGAAFSRVKPKNRDSLHAAQAAGRLQVKLVSTVRAIDADTVTLDTVQGACTVANDAIIVCAGGVLPIALLQSVGVRFETKHGTA